CGCCQIQIVAEREFGDVEGLLVEGAGEDLLERRRLVGRLDALDRNQAGHQWERAIVRGYGNAEWTAHAVKSSQGMQTVPSGVAFQLAVSMSSGNDRLHVVELGRATCVRRLRRGNHRILTRAAVSLELSFSAAF